MLIARPCSSDLRCASLSLHSNADISLSKYANDQLSKQSDVCEIISAFKNLALVYQKLS